MKGSLLSRLTHSLRSRSLSQDAVSNKLISVCAKMGGLLTNSTNQGELMADQITTKTILNLKKGIIKLTVGCSIVWFGGLIRMLVLEKVRNCEERSD